MTPKSNLVQQGDQIVREERKQGVSREAFQALLKSGELPGFCASAVCDIIGETDLRPVLEVWNNRELRGVIHKDPGLVAEVSLDDIIFFQNGKKAPYFGIEVETKGNGSYDDLGNISTFLRRLFPELEPDAESKFEKGMRLPM